jgi:uncharacterized membrane protein YphA (DoxX/SURF4 family)
MLSSFGSSGSGRASQSPLDVLRTVSLLRIGTGAVLLFFHGYAAAIKGWQFALKQVPWDVADTLTRAALPLPNVLAVGYAIVVCAVGLSWVVGFITRLFATVFLPVVVVGMIVGQRLAIPGSVEVGLLYLLITVTLLIFGSGKASMDTLFNLGSAPKKRR